MDVATRLDYFRKEHEEFLHFLHDCEYTLKATVSRNLKEVAQLLDRLRQMQPRLEAIRNHCFCEDLGIEGMYGEHLAHDQLVRLRHEHFALGGLVTDLFAELRFATKYEISRARGTGQEVVAFARQHIDFEQELLEEIERKLIGEEEQEQPLRYFQAAK